MLRKKRRQLGYSQEYVAIELGISQKAYSDLENGKTKLRGDVLLQLSEVFKVMPFEICSLYKNCKCISNIELEKNEYKDKYIKIIQFLYKNNIKIPDDLF